MVAGRSGAAKFFPAERTYLSPDLSGLMQQAAIPVDPACRAGLFVTVVRQSISVMSKTVHRPDSFVVAWYPDPI